MRALAALLILSLAGVASAGSSATRPVAHMGADVVATEPTEFKIARVALLAAFVLLGVAAPKKRRLIVPIAAVVVGVIVGVVIETATTDPPALKPIEAPIELALAGYLGIFFRAASETLRDSVRPQGGRGAAEQKAEDGTRAP